jgi:beta-glucosidase
MKLFATLTLVALSGGPAFPQSAPARAVRAVDPVEARVTRLLQRMTLEEKIGQLQQLDGEVDGRFRPEHLELARQGRLGSTLNVRGAANVNELQKAAVEGSRLGIPLLFGFDTIHGYRTIFPIPLGEAASFDASLAEETARVAAAESAAVGLKWTFAPMVDIARDPRWGRIAEGAGEDPYLGSVLARARVRGFQGTDYSQPDRVVATAKHWVAYGAAEAGRDYNTTDVSERALRETYFPPFHAAVDAGVGTLMSAFNDVDGTPATANPFTLTKVLRGEWSFRGFVVSDYTSVLELMNHRLAADEAEAAQKALTAGTDMEMVSRLYAKHLPELVKKGRRTRRGGRRGRAAHPARQDPGRALRAPVRRRRARAGGAAHARVPRAGAPRGRAVDRAAAERGRPAAAEEGPAEAGCDRPARGRREGGERHLGRRRPSGGHGLDPGRHPQGDRRPARRVRQGLRRRRGHRRGRRGRGRDRAGRRRGRAGGRRVRGPVGRGLVAQPARPARQADGPRPRGARAGKPTVVVLASGRPLTIPWIAEHVPAVVMAWHGGTEAGNAAADVLFGDVNPGGKLPVTFPRSVGQVPLYYAHKSTGRPPDPDQKYTSKYLDVPVTPQFPFGHGLSYTTFALSDLRLGAQAIAPSGT